MNYVAVQHDTVKRGHEQSAVLFVVPSLLLRYFNSEIKLKGNLASEENKARLEESLYKSIH